MAKASIDINYSTSDFEPSLPFDRSRISHRDEHENRFGAGVLILLGLSLTLWAGIIALVWKFL